MKARKVVADLNSTEVDQLRRGYNNLLRVIEGFAASLDAGATAEAVLAAFAAGVAAGLDSNPDTETNVVATNLPLEGVKPEPLAPKAVRGSLVDSTSSDKY